MIVTLGRPSYGAASSRCMRSLRCIGSFGRTNDLTSFKKWVNLRRSWEGGRSNSSDQKSDGLYSLHLPQDFQAEPQRVGPTLFGAISYGRKAAVDRRLHWNGLKRT